VVAVSVAFDGLVGVLNQGAGAVFGLVLTTGFVTAVVTKLFDKGAKRDERVRDGYAATTAALVAWGEFPYRVARRTSDENDALAALASRGHDAQEMLACRRAWVVGESAVMGEAYAAIAAQLRPQVAVATQAAWRRLAIGSGSGMVLSDGEKLPSVDVQLAVDLWCVALRYRFGWRRWVFLPATLRAALRRRGIPLPARQTAAVSRSHAGRNPEGGIAPAGRTQVTGSGSAAT